MAPRRQPTRGARGREAPEGFVRVEDVQRLVQEALAAEQAQQATQQEQTPAEEPGPILERPLEDHARDLEYERYSKCLERFQKL